MITVEELLDALATLVAKGTIKDNWHRNFIYNVQNHVLGGSCLSTNQAQVVLKVAAKHNQDVAREVNKPLTIVDAAIARPTYKKPPYTSISVKREVRYLGMDKLAFRFKLDNTVVAELKSLKSAHDPINSAPYFNSQYRLWIVTVTPQNLDKIFGIIQRHKFDFDEGVLEYMTLCTNSKKQPSTFMAADEDTHVANITNNPLLSHVVRNIMKGEPV